MLIKKNRASIIIILILSGGMFNSYLIAEDDTVNYNVPDFEILRLFTSVYEIETYVSGCEKAMYENGTFYNNSDVFDCKNNVTTNFDDKMEDFDKPDFKYFTIDNTGYRAEFSKDIYEIKIIGTYCENTDLSNILARETKCTNQIISKIFMAQNIDFDDWGFATKGFETTDGKYLEVIRP
tara:strand:- start:4032 stop:4571 length:540 start_codon:yes stop_codon:yes gene_type:complete